MDALKSGKKILMVQPTIHLPGGSTGVCVWMLEALKEEYDLTLLSWKPVDWDAVNRDYGTALRPSDVKLCRPHPFANRLEHLMPFHSFLLKSALLMRQCRWIAQGYDLVISCDNEADFGCRGIQYVHFPRYFFPRPDVGSRWVHRLPGILKGYYALCTLISGYSPRRMRRNVTLTNSEWTAAKMQACSAGIPCRVVRPPVHGSFPDVDWGERENGFVCVGRIAPEKEMEKVIEIVGRVRERRTEAHLHLIGHPDDPSYFSRLAGIVSRHASWVSLEVSPSRSRLAELTARHRYGIHGMREEHYGTAVAEMVAAGCIVFAPDGGGQKEILGFSGDLLYDSAEDAVGKICRVMDSSRLQEELRLFLKDKKRVSTVERFCSRIREIVAEF